jgi:hypothetical protein
MFRSMLVQLLAWYNPIYVCDRIAAHAMSSCDIIRYTATPQRLGAWHWFFLQSYIPAWIGKKIGLLGEQWIHTSGTHGSFAVESKTFVGPKLTEMAGRRQTLAVLTVLYGCPAEFWGPAGIWFVSTGLACTMGPDKLRCVWIRWWDVTKSNQLVGWKLESYNQIWSNIGCRLQPKRNATATVCLESNFGFFLFDQ